VRDALRAAGHDASRLSSKLVGQLAPPSCGVVGRRPGRFCHTGQDFADITRHEKKVGRVSNPSTPGGLENPSYVTFFLPR